MARKHKRPDERELNGLGGRVRRLARELYGGNQAAMAKDLGVSQPLISKVVRGEQEPGPKLLAALVKNPKLNPRWLMEGVGEPVPPGEGPLDVVGPSLPVFKRIQSAPHGGDTDPFVALRFPLGPLLKPTVYLLEVQPGDAVLRFPELSLAAGDLLALDGDASAWRGRPQVLTDRLVAARLRLGEACDYRLARVVAPVSDDAVKVQFFEFEDFDKPHLTVPDRARKSRSRAIDLDDPGSGPRDPAKIPPVRPPGAGDPDNPPAVELSATDILACCVLVMRTSLFRNV